MRRRITLDIDEDLLQALDSSAGRSGLSRNQWILESVGKHLKELKRRETDEAFLQMAHDPEYQSEMTRLEAEMAHASDEAWLLMERAEKARVEAPPDKPSSRRSA